MSKLHAKKKRQRRARDYKPQAGSNAEFIANHIHLPVPEVMRLAKKEKRPMSVKAVYTARSVLRKRGITGNAATLAISKPDEVEVIGVVPRHRSNGHATGDTATASAEAELRRLLLQLGSIRARSLIHEYEKQIEGNYV